MCSDLSSTALSLLKHGEICIVVLKDGTQREAAWSVHSKGFHFSDGKGPGFVQLSEIDEWWPASVPF